jgi:hypothetical protein
MKTFPSQLYSDNPKSKTCGEPSRTIQKRPPQKKIQNGYDPAQRAGAGE